MVRVALPEGVPEGGTLQLVIKTENESVNLAELAAFLAFVDRTYGRLSSRGLRSYSRARDAQAQADLKAGSLEVILETVAKNSDTLVVLWLVLKYAPTGLKDLATGYRELEEGAYTRARRKQLREQMKADRELAQLDRNRLNQLVRFLGALYAREHRSIPRVRRFTLRYLKRVFFRVREK